MTDNVATLAGYTRSVTADSDNGMYTLFLLVRPDVDLDERFRAYDTDAQEWINVNGWNFSFKEGH